MRRPWHAGAAPITGFARVLPQALMCGGVHQLPADVEEIEEITCRRAWRGGA